MKYYLYTYNFQKPTTKYERKKYFYIGQYVFYYIIIYYMTLWSSNIAILVPNLTYLLYLSGYLCVT